MIILKGFLSITFRVFGFRIDAAWPLNNLINTKYIDNDGDERVKSFAPRIHLGIDVGA
jgi:hypothetical protein